MDTPALNDRDFVAANVRRIAASMGVPRVNAELAVDEALHALGRGSDRWAAVQVGSVSAGRVRVAHVKHEPRRLTLNQPYRPVPRYGVSVPAEASNDPSWLRRCVGAVFVVALAIGGVIWVGNPF